jgi:hypothetical protein
MHLQTPPIRRTLSYIHTYIQSTQNPTVPIIRHKTATGRQVIASKSAKMNLRSTKDAQLCRPKEMHTPGAQVGLAHRDRDTLGSASQGRNKIRADACQRRRPSNQAPPGARGDSTSGRLTL